MVVNFPDHTRQIEQYDDLQEAKYVLENLLDSSADSIGVVDAKGRFTRWNGASEEIFGYSPAEIKEKHFSELYEDPAELEIMLTRLRRDGFVRKYEINMKKKDGSIAPFNLSINLLYDRQHNLTGSLCIARDRSDTRRALAELRMLNERLENEITERKLAEEALKESQKSLANIIDFLPDATLVIDKEGKVIAWNKAIEEMTGIKASDMVGKGNYEYALPFWGQRRPILIDLVFKPREKIEKYTLVKREGLALSAVFYHPNFRGGGTYLFGKASILLDFHGNIIGAIESIRDITLHQRAEAERQRLSKLEAIGTLAGGIAHDFNNILTAITGYISLAMLDPQMGERSRGRLTKADQACQQAQNLARQLLTFAKGGAPIKELVSLEKLVAESGSLACRGSQVRCELTFPKELQSIEVDSGQINQVFQNLIINAIQAMPQGGTIEITGENIKVGKHGRLPLETGNYVKVSIKDKGVGIPKEYLQKIFDPYFTTKQKGSGLGLATVYSIIKKHNGLISAESRLGEGSTFHVYLPASDQKIMQQPKEIRELLSGKGKILVMDDEAMVREVLGMMLLTLGYEAKFAKDGVEAIELFSQAQGSADPFAAVILDLTVPGGMGGREAMAKLLKIDPQVKAMVSSGYFDDPIMADFQKYGFAGVIAKPYKVAELGKVLNKVLTKGK
jgi:PAS domain S-box-containing protein